MACLLYLELYCKIQKLVVVRDSGAKMGYQKESHFVHV